jgi:hypothetical protein
MTSWEFESHRPDYDEEFPTPSLLGFHFQRAQQESTVHVPYWFPVLITGALTLLPWIRWRFSLKTLLIAATVIALALGLIFATTR